MLKTLRTRVGKDAFHVVDYREADLCAVGAARPDNHDVLVYVNTFRKPPDPHFISLELAPTAGVESPYTPARDREVESFNELVGLIQKHSSSYPFARQ